MDTNPDCTPYGEPLYWDRRYDQTRKKEGVGHNFDWHMPAEELFPFIEQYVGRNRGFRILILGTGSSKLPEVLHARGFTQVTCIDTSKAVIAHLSHRYQHLQGLEFLNMDARYLDRFDDETFDTVVEKGFLDTMYCSLQTFDGVLTVLQEVHRVLKPHANFISVSGGPERTRIPHLSHHSLHWEVDHATVPRRPLIHIYSMTKLLPEEEVEMDEEANKMYRTNEDDKAAEQARVQSMLETGSAGVTMKRAQTGFGGNVKIAGVRDSAFLLRAFQEGRINLALNQQGTGGI